MACKQVGTFKTTRNRSTPGLHPENATSVGLLALAEQQEVAVHKLCEEEVHPSEDLSHWSGNSRNAAGSEVPAKIKGEHEANKKKMEAISRDRASKQVSSSCLC